MDNSSSEGSESSDYDEVSSSELSTSSESSSEEQSCSRGKGKGSARTGKTSKGNASSAQSAPSRKKRKVEDKLNAEEMEELTSWIFSSEQAVEVAMQLRSTLLSDLRIKGELERFAKELLSDVQKQHFQLLLSGFCRKFSTLAQESYKSSIPTYRKVAFSVAWMKFLSNFHPGKSTQEWMIAERILKNSNEEFSVAAVHGVLSVIHERVYSVIHDHVRLRKAEIETTGTP